MRGGRETGFPDRGCRGWVSEAFKHIEPQVANTHWTGRKGRGVVTDHMTTGRQVGKGGKLDTVWQAEGHWLCGQSWRWVAYSQF